MIKQQSNPLPDKVLKDMWKDESFQQNYEEVGKIDPSEIQATLDQLLLLQKSDPLFDVHLAIRFLSQLEATSVDVDPDKLKTFLDGLWNRVTTQKESPVLIKHLVGRKFDHISQKLDNIASESDKDGWELIKYIEGFSQIFDLCVRDTSGTFFQAVLKYFIEKVSIKAFIGTVSQEMAKVLMNDLRYRIGARKFCALFPEKLKFCTAVLEESNGISKDLTEMMLMDLLLSNKEDFLMVTIGYEDHSYLIEKVYEAEAHQIY